MQETTNYKLKKLELTDSPADITVLNENWDKLDTEVKEHDSSLISHDQSITEINEELEGINTELDSKYDKAGGTINGNVNIASGGLTVTGDSTFNDNVTVKGITVHEDTIRSTKANFLETKVNVSRGTPPDSTLYSYWSVFDKDGYAEVQKKSRLAYIDYSITNTGISSVGLYVNKYVADDREIPVGLFARWVGETPQIRLTHTPPANSNDKSIATTDWVRALRATASEYGLIKLADESDLLSEAEDTALSVGGAYELSDFRRKSTAYALGDTVSCAFNSEYFLECTQAGTTSSGSLDTRNVTFGQVITDGTCRWTVRRRLKGINGELPDENGNIEIDVDTGNLAKLNAENTFTKTQNIANTSPATKLKNSDVTRGTKPSATEYWTHFNCDAESRVMSGVRGYFKSDGTNGIQFIVNENVADGGTDTALGLEIKGDGGVYAYVPTPANTADGNEIVTAKWANSNLPKLNTDNIFTSNIQSLAHPITKGSTGSASDTSIRFVDNQGGTTYAANTFGTLLNRVFSNGDVETALYAHKNDTSSNVNSYISIRYPINGNPYATAPTPNPNATGKEIVNAQWARANLLEENRRSSLSTVSDLNFSAANMTDIPDLSVLTFWNGAWNGNKASNLLYCVHGQIVGTTGNQTIGGTKTFSAVPVCAVAPTANTHIANKKYVDDTVTGKAMGAPDYSAGITISTAINSTYTVPQNGYLVILMDSNSVEIRFSINNTVNFDIEGAYYAIGSSDGPSVPVNSGNDTVIPVAKNDVIKILFYNRVHGRVSFKFFPSK